MPEGQYDVLIVGYGPVAAGLAVMLGRRGVRVAVFERWEQRYDLPRAVCIDHEMYRMLSDIGFAEVLPDISHAAPPYCWYNAEWKELLSIDWSKESASGGAEVNFVHQPTLEAALDAQVRRQPSVDVLLGWEVLEVGQDAEGAFLVAEHRTSGERLRASASYLVGCDGANSLVRRTIGEPQDDLGFQADWLVIDLLPHEDARLDIPPAAQWCNPARPTTIVPAGVRDGRRFRRWEFMLLPGETISDMEQEAFAWRLLEPWVRPDQATLLRHRVYTFRSLVARTWREGRLFLAGDAAHVMPPFMGQGMCSGLRDAWTLTWRLDLVLSGRAGPELFDSYQAERAPHVTDITRLATYLGRMICQPDPRKAAERDAAFFAGEAPPPPPFPHLTHGVLAPETPPRPDDPAGRLCPHGRIRRAGREGRFDELVGAGRFHVVAADVAMLDAFSPAARDTLLRLEMPVVALDGPAGDDRVVADLDGKYARFLDDHGVAALVVRPDFYVYGGARDAAELDALLEGLAPALHLRAAPAPTPEPARTMG